jgi:hypothetical protein
MNTDTYTTTQYETNALGFPVDECSRCNGSGTYSYNPRDGYKCFGCLGTGKQIIKKARKAWEAFQQEITDRKNCNASNLSIGDRIAHNKTWCEVIAVAVTPRISMWMGTGDDKVPCGFQTYVTVNTRTDNGDIIELIKYNNDTRLRRYTGDIDVTRFLAMIPKDRQPKVAK